MTSHIAVVWNPSKTEKETLEAGLTEAIGEGVTPEISWWETTEEDPGQGAHEGRARRGGGSDHRGRR